MSKSIQNLVNKIATTNPQFTEFELKKWIWQQMIKNKSKCY